MKPLPDLPVSKILGEISGKLATGRKLVLGAPPGAGKTTLVPLELLKAPWLGEQKIVVLEPRRLAARAAARRMASLLGEPAGETVGYVMRLDRKQSQRTRILVVTEGVFARMALDDPELNGIGAVLFDEFHERSLDADLGLALALDIAGALRPDLRIIVMSATLDCAAISALMDNAPVITSEGRSFPVDIRYLERPPGTAIEAAMAGAIRNALVSEEGGILAFLPGQAEIRRTLDLLKGRHGDSVDIIGLHGGLDGKAQDAAIRPADEGRRKVVLTTAIAESSITIDDVRIVIDSGLARLPKFEPATGITRLETVRVSQASATQRAGRAGRTAPGVAIRLWNENQTRALPAFSPPEITEADLSGLVLDCAAFGVMDPAQLSFVDPPPKPALAEARLLLETLGALDPAGRLTATGQRMRRIGLPVRLAHMVAIQQTPVSAQKAARLAMIISERGLGGPSVDLDERLQRSGQARDTRSRSAWDLADRVASLATDGSNSPTAPGLPATGVLLAAAYPDRIAKARGEPGQYVLANGRGAHMDPAEPIAASPFIVVADLQGKARSQRIAAAAAIDEDDIRSLEGVGIEQTGRTFLDAASRTVRSEAIEKLGAIVLSRKTQSAPRGEDANKAIMEAVRERGIGILPWDGKAQGLRARLAWLHQTLGSPWPDVSDEALCDTIDDWLLPFLSGEPSLAALAGQIMTDALRSHVPSGLQPEIDRHAPEKFSTPEGSAFSIRYDAEGPVLPVRVQLLYGLKTHPAIAGGSEPLILELLSPAGRPIQKTRDLPGFWAGSWADVRTEMRGRYPKHFWPEDPAAATPTARAKPR